jgi:hypothetical protein
MKNLCVIVPTRERPHKIDELITQFAKTREGDTDLLVCLDEDDSWQYKPQMVKYGHSWLRWEVGDGRKRLNPWLNKQAPIEAEKYKYIGFMGDDHRPRTNGWDVKLTDALEPYKYGVSYGNDLLQGMNLATACIQTSTIIRKLGFFSPPKQTHLFLDNYWMALGIKTNLVYLDDVILEHMHFINNKSQEDRLYTEVNAPGPARQDQLLWEEYVMSGEFQKDIDKLD